jgi:hypothetical protein
MFSFLKIPAGDVRIERLWWLNPAIVFAVMVPGTMALAVSLSRDSYLLYRVPKYLDESHFLLSLLATAMVIGGFVWATRTGATPKTDTGEYTGLLTKAFFTFAGLTFLGYAIWVAFAVARGLTPGMFLKFFSSAADADFGLDLKETYFKTIPGVTTAAQFQVSAIILGMLPGVFDRRFVKPMLAALFMMAFLRAVFLTERLALIEVCVVSGVIAMRRWVLGQRTKRWFAVAMKGFPVAAVIGLIVLFGTFESIRSWRYYKDKFNSIAEFTLWRVGAYYTTCHNNSAMFLERQGSWPLPYSTLQAMWAFPLIENSPLGYEKLVGYDPDKEYLDILQRNASPEYNNEGGLFQPLIDFGMVGYVIFYVGLGFVAGRLYRAYLAGAIYGLLYFPPLMMHILETPRFLYLNTSRTFPTHAALLSVLFLIWLVQRAKEQASLEFQAVNDVA